MKKELFKINSVIIFLAILSISFQGYSLIHNDLLFYMPLIKHNIDNNLYPNNLLIEHLEKVPMFLFSTIAFLSQFINIKWVFFIGHLITRYLLCLSVFLVSYTLFKNKLSSYLSIILVLSIGGLTLGGVGPTQKILVQMYLVIPILLFSIYYFLRNKYLASYLLLALSTYIHIRFMIVIFTLYSFYFLLNYKKINKKIIISYLLFFLIALPMIISILSMSFSPMNIELVNRLKLISSYEIFPFMLNFQQISLFSLVVLAFLISLKFKPSQENHKKIISFIWAIIILCILAVISTEIILIPFFIKASFHKTTTIFFTIIALMYISNYLITSSKKRGLLGITSLILIPLIIIHWASPVFISHEKGFLNRIEFPWQKENDYIDGRYEPHYKKMVFWIKDNTPINSNFITPLFKPYGFSAYSERNNIIDWRLMTASQDHLEFSSKAWERFEDICKADLDGLTEKELKTTCEENYKLLNEEDIIKIANKYNSNYIIFKKQKILDFEILYENEEYIIYEVPLKIPNNSKVNKSLNTLN